MQPCMYGLGRVVSFTPFVLHGGQQQGPPTFGGLWGTTLHKNLAIFFYFFISLVPKESKSTKKFICLFSQGVPLTNHDIELICLFCFKALIIRTPFMK